MKEKFKRGDQVVCIDATGVSTQVAGKTYTVYTYMDDFVYVKDCEGKEFGGYYETRFKKGTKMATKRKSKTIKNTAELQMKALTEKYATDGMCPGMVASVLKDGKVYVSLVRYPSGQKQVLISRTGTDMNDLIEALARDFADLGKTALEDLRSHLKAGT